MKIDVGFIKSPPLSVDTEEDLSKVKILWRINEKRNSGHSGELGAYSHLAAINFFKNPEIKTAPLLKRLSNCISKWL